MGISSEIKYCGIKIKINNKNYGVVLEVFNNKDSILTTAFSDKEKNIDNWMKKEILSQAKNTSSVTTKGMLLSKGLNNIINYVKQNFNPDTKLYQEANKLYQEMEGLKYC